MSHSELVERVRAGLVFGSVNDPDSDTGAYAALSGLIEQLETAQQEASDMRKAAAGMSSDLTHFAQENAHLEEQYETLRLERDRLRAALGQLAGGISEPWASRLQEALDESDLAAASSPASEPNA